MCGCEILSSRVPWFLSHLQLPASILGLTRVGVPSSHLTTTPPMLNQISFPFAVVHQGLG